MVYSQDVETCAYYRIAINFAKRGKPEKLKELLDPPLPAAQEIAPPQTADQGLATRVVLKDDRLEGPSLKYPLLVLNVNDYRQRSSSRSVGIESGYEIWDGFPSGRVNGCAFQALGINVHEFWNWFKQNNTAENRQALAPFFNGIIGDSGGQFAVFCSARGLDAKQEFSKIYTEGHKSVARDRQMREKFFIDGNQVAIDYFEWYMTKAVCMLSPEDVRNFSKALGMKVLVHTGSVSASIAATPDTQHVLLRNFHFQRLFR